MYYWLLGQSFEVSWSLAADPKVSLVKGEGLPIFPRLEDKSVVAYGNEICIKYKLQGTALERLPSDKRE